MHPTSFLKSLYLLSRNAESCNVHTGEHEVSMQPLKRETSVADILESKRMDPEIFLSNIGFVQHDMSLLQRLPHRFFVAQRDQKLTKQFLSMHPEFQENEEHEALSAVAEIFARIPPSFHHISPSEPCTQLHKIIASHSPLARQRLRRQSPVFTSTDTVQVTPRISSRADSVSSKRRHHTKSQSSLATIGETGSFSAKPPSSGSGGSLSSCDVTDESSDGEHSPLILQNRQPVLHLFNQDHILNMLARQSHSVSFADDSSESETDKPMRPNASIDTDETLPHSTTLASHAPSHYGKDVNVCGRNLPKRTVKFSERENSLDGSIELTPSSFDGINFTRFDDQSRQSSTDQQLSLPEASQTLLSSAPTQSTDYIHKNNVEKSSRINNNDGGSWNPTDKFYQVSVAMSKANLVHDKGKGKVLCRQSTVHNPGESSVASSVADDAPSAADGAPEDSDEDRRLVDTKPSVKPLPTYTIRKRICGTSRITDIDGEGHK